VSDSAAGKAESGIAFTALPAWIAVASVNAAPSNATMSAAELPAK